MSDNKYMVIINIGNRVVAENMDIETAMILVKALFDTYYYETDMSITVKAMPKTKGGKENA